MPDAQTVLSRLAEQCSTPDAVHDFFLNEGITGFTGTWSKCPIANYLLRETGEEWGVDPAVATPIRTSIDDYPYPYILLGETLRKFIHKFDDGDYEDLIVKEDWFYWEVVKKGKGN